jgi:hypothetical protein
MDTSTLLLVRVWQQRDADGRPAFRASVRPVDGESERLFTRVADLARYLRRMTPAASHRSEETA